MRVQPVFSFMHFDPTTTIHQTNYFYPLDVVTCREVMNIP